MDKRYFLTHRVFFRDGHETAPYRLTQSWKTVKGALRAGERFCEGIGKHYDNVAYHGLSVYDEQGQFVTNEAA